MTALTPEALAELERLERKAEAGPWRFILEDDAYAILHSANEGETIAFVPQDTSKLAKTHAALLVALRNAAPALIASARALAESRAECERLREASGKVIDAWERGRRILDLKKAITNLDAVRGRVGK